MSNLLTILLMFVYMLHPYFKVNGFSKHLKWMAELSPEGTVVARGSRNVVFLSNSSNYVVRVSVSSPNLEKAIEVNITNLWEGIGLSCVNVNDSFCTLLQRLSSEVVVLDFSNNIGIWVYPSHEAENEHEQAWKYSSTPGLVLATPPSPLNYDYVLNTELIIGNDRFPLTCHIEFAAKYMGHIQDKQHWIETDFLSLIHDIFYDQSRMLNSFNTYHTDCHPLNILYVTDIHNVTHFVWNDFGYSNGSRSMGSEDMSTRLHPQYLVSIENVLDTLIFQANRNEYKNIIKAMEYIKLSHTKRNGTSPSIYFSEMLSIIQNTVLQFDSATLNAFFKEGPRGFFIPYVNRELNRLREENEAQNQKIEAQNQIIDRLTEDIRFLHAGMETMKKILIEQAFSRKDVAEEDPVPGTDAFAHEL